MHHWFSRRLSFIFNTCNGGKKWHFRALEKHFGFASKSKFNLEDNPTVVINQKELMNWIAIKYV